MRMRRRNTHYSAWDLVERKRFRETIQYDLLVVFTKRDLIAQHQSLGMFVQRVILPEWRRALVITIDMSTMLASMPAARVAGQPRAIRVPHTVIPILPRSRHTASIRTRSSMRFTTPTDSNPWFFSTCIFICDGRALQRHSPTDWYPWASCGDSLSCGI